MHQLRATGSTGSSQAPTTSYWVYWLFPCTNLELAHRKTQ
ncbi:hypothetical protein PR002_g2992 [Phytophthora rubi]|uniref:Uncharacterized protein n=1 Tax=Phytophthora rubi TaxID=129364 RepID=A0A6A3NKL6_9STRA|nr:hypothetical protein PR002_g2992 [Phytophthora rubi]